MIISRHRRVSNAVDMRAGNPWGTLEALERSRLGAWWSFRCPEGHVFYELSTNVRVAKKRHAANPVKHKMVSCPECKRINRT